MSTLRAIIFDFDGVIADTEPLHYAGLERTFRAIGITLTESDYYTNYLGFDDRGCVVAALQANGRPITQDIVQDLMRKKAIAYLESIKDHLVIFPGVREFVLAAAAQYPLAIASGALRQEIELILEQAGLRKAFLHITSAEDVSRGKPDPQPFQYALAGLTAQRPSLDLDATSCLVIEDSLPGIRAAKSAGMKVLAVANTHTVQDLHEAHAITHSLADTTPADLERRLWASA